METPYSIQSFNYSMTLSFKPSDEKVMEMLLSMKEMGANTMTLTWNVFIDPNGFMSSSKNDKYYSASFDELEKVIKMAQSVGLDVWLKPHYETDDGRTHVAHYNPSFINTEENRINFLNSITEYSKTVAEFAEKNGIVGYNIATEHSGIENQHYDKWENLIHEIRERFSGKLTYSSSGFPFSEWEGNAGADDVVFWNLLDYIGIDAYFPTSTNNFDPTIDEIYQGWLKNSINYKIDHNIVYDLEKLSIMYNKPILFTELGYHAMNGSNIHTWNMNLENGVLDLQEQSDLIEGWFRVFTDHNTGWIAGLNWWGYHNIPSPIAFDDLWMKSMNVYNKPAQYVMTDWFMGNKQYYDIQIGTSFDDKILGAYHHDVLYGGLGNDTIFGNQGMDTIHAGRGNDIINGNSNNDFLFGNIGNDIISAGTGDDIVYGGQDDDLIYGNDGNDTLTGNLGNDYLVGGPGFDIFIIGQGFDTIEDFNPEEDSIIGPDGDYIIEDNNIIFSNVTILNQNLDYWS